MRLWSLHPKYLDYRGLVALWREGLLAKKVLEGKTRGYKHHPQLTNFKNQKNSKKFISTYLLYVWREAERRGYHFDGKKLGKSFTKEKIKITEKELMEELKHLKKKLRKRNHKKYNELRIVRKPKPNPVFRAS
ncbi:MAG: pyrimidine dimer DNA glycosylase/endonuclease V [Candidatus Micrarchaeia archaeon]